MNLVDLMCEFVEAMNPGLRLSRHPEILKDRDLCGELKDVWNAVQQVRDKEKAGIQQIESENIVVYTEFGPDSAPSYKQAVTTIPVCPLASTETETDPVLTTTTIIQSQDTQVCSGMASICEPIKDCKVNKDSEKVVTDNKKTLDEKSQVKVNNQKNRESSHHFFPKFLSSSNKDQKDSHTKNEDDETSKKPKKTLNFFRRNKTAQATPASPRKIIQENCKEEILEQNGNMLRKLDDLEGEKELVEAGVANVYAK